MTFSADDLASQLERYGKTYKQVAIVVFTHDCYDGWQWLRPLDIPAWRKAGHRHCFAIIPDGRFFIHVEMRRGQRLITRVLRSSGGGPIGSDIDPMNLVALVRQIYVDSSAVNLGEGRQAPAVSSVKAFPIRTPAYRLWPWVLFTKGSVGFVKLHLGITERGIHKPADLAYYIEKGDKPAGKTWDRCKAVAAFVWRWLKRLNQLPPMPAAKPGGSPFGSSPFGG